MSILKVYLLLCLTLLTSCQSQVIQKNWSLFKSHLQTKQTTKSYQSIPPRNLKTFQPSKEPQLEVLKSFSTKDRFGNERLQLYILNNTQPSEALLRSILSKYKSNYSVVWIYLVSSKEHLAQEEWSAQAAWFASKITSSQHYLGFNPEHHINNFYWLYE